jgi:hypothetical protein
MLVQLSITYVDTSKAFGYDEISPKLIKLCAEILLIPLTDLFQMSIETAAIPDKWKIHIIIPSTKMVIGP